MKKLHILLFTLLALFILACDDDEDLKFDQESNERVEQVFAKCDEVLKSAANGWRVIYIPREEKTGGFNILMKFSDGGIVNMDGDFVDAATESTYSYNASQGPVLSFDSYAVIHELADPDKPGLSPSGLEGDFEFIILETTPDSVVFKGKKSQERVVFRKAQATDWTELIPQAKIHLKQLAPTTNDYFFRTLSLEMGGQEVDAVNFIYDSTYRTGSVTWADHGLRKTETYIVAVYGTETGVAFIPQVIVNGLRVTGMKYDGTGFIVEENGMTGRLAYQNESPVPFYGSFTNLRDSSNSLALPLISEIDPSNITSFLLNAFNALSVRSNMSSELQANFIQAVIGGMKQFRISWRAPFSAMDEGVWLTYYGSNGGALSMLSPATFYSFKGVEAINMDENRGDRVRFDSIPGLHYNTDSTFASTMSLLQFPKDMNNFIFDVNGFTVVPAGNNRYYLVNLLDSRRWLLLNRN